MFIITSYTLAIVFCSITMICWGSWANTQKLVQHKMPFELYYWDYVLGIFIIALLSAFTMGSIGTQGRSFLTDIVQVSPENLGNAFLGGVVFNLANILLTAAISAAGMAVAFPIGIGLALVIGVILNYRLEAKGDLTLLTIGVLLVVLAIVFNAVAFRRHKGERDKGKVGKWVLVSIVAGILMSTFYPFVAKGMDLENFAAPQAGKMTPYTAFVVFSIGILISNFVFNGILMKRPLSGSPIAIGAYFKLGFKYHLIGWCGGIIWGVGNLFNLIAAGKAGPAISYGLGQGATLVAALWGVFVWKEFKGSTTSTNRLITVMFLCFIAGLIIIIQAGQN
ncbi:GRP family sugar transporter [Sphingobacterium sp. SYP-B4668]|uniref:GRP family sugar transporter n=1 Tax=Sphingobacterium sp. SYP-B4668 TaxID=2996035 RepID=UPI0022DE312F|nr:GRP family sugar transporter [Sphingobacterium sp. SYP-B4668]